VSVTAIITCPMDGALGDSGSENPYHITGYTVEQFSSDSSTFAGPDTKIVDTRWSAEDGWTDSGRQVQHRFDTAGVHTITCTVTGDAGSTHQTTKQITSAVFAPTWERFVKQGGTDPGGPGSGGTSDGNAWATLEYGFNEWRALGSAPGRKGQLGVLWVKRDSVITFAGLANATHDPSPDHGFLIIAPYGTGANPIINFNDGTGISCNAGSHVPDEWGWAVYLRDLTCTWAARSESNTIALGNPGSQLDGVPVTKAFIPLSSTFGKAFINGGVTLSGKDGLFPSANWVILDNLVINQNCLAGVNAEHQVYGSAGLNHFAYRRLTVTGSVEGNDGLRNVSARLGYVADCTVTSIFNAGDAYFPGANNIGDRHCSQYLAERVIAASANSAVNFNSTDDALLRNFIAKLGTGAWGVRLASLNATDRADNVRVYHGVFYGNAGRDLLTDAVATNLTCKNSIFMRTDAAAILNIADASHYTSDWNCFWRVGGTPGADTTFAIVNGVTKTFAEWQGLGKDTHSMFQDPKFTNAAGGVFTLQATSPCIAAAPKLGEVPRDFLDVARATTTAMGAYEVVTSPPPQNPPPGCGDRLATYQASMKEVYALGGSIRRGIFN